MASRSEHEQVLEADGERELAFVDVHGRRLGATEGVRSVLLPMTAVMRVDPLQEHASTTSAGEKRRKARHGQVVARDATSSEPVAGPAAKIRYLGPPVAGWARRSVLVHLRRSCREPVAGWASQ